MALEEPLEDDIVETINGIQVAVDKRIESNVQEITLDFQGDQLVMLGTNSCC